MSKSSSAKLLATVLLLALAGWVVSVFAASGEPVTAVYVSSTPTVRPTPRMPGKIGTGDDWIILDLPANASQIDYGREIYRLVCSACHGDVGQGLTAEWRSTWAPEDQNCWQSKCHGPNRPPEGFPLPVAPAINALAKRNAYPTAVELQAYIHAAMPWYKPGGLSDERAWQVTAYVLKLNGIDAGPALNARTAAQIRLALDTPMTSEPAAVDSGGQQSQTITWFDELSPLAPVLILAVLAISLFAGFVWKRRKGRL